MLENGGTKVKNLVKGKCRACKTEMCDDLDPVEGICIMCYTSPSKVAARAASGVPKTDSGVVVVDGGGLRYNNEKLRYDLMPTDSVAEFVKVLTYGAKKYAARNWERGQPWSVPYASCMRHLQAWHSGEDIDSESGLLHLAHAVCNLMFLLAFHRRGMVALDDREHLGRRDIRALQHSGVVK